MTGANETVRARRRRRAAVLAVAFLLVVASGIAIRAQAKRGVQRELQAIRERDLPASAQEVNAWYASVPPAENSALVILRAYDLYVEPGENDPRVLSKGLVLGQPLPPKLAGAIANLVEDNREAIAELHKAAQLPASRYPVDLTPGFAALLPHLSRAKRMAELLKWEAIYHSARGERANAVRAVESGFAVAASLKEEPVFISMLVRMSCLWITLGSLERVLTEHELTEVELQRFIALARTAENDCTPSLRRGLLGERGTGISAFSMSYRTLFSDGKPLTSMEAKELLFLAKFELRRLLGGHGRDLSFYLARMAEAEAALQMEPAKMIREGERIQKASATAFRQSSSDYTISQAILPGLSGLSGAMVKNALLIAQLRCIQVALEIEKFRLKNNEQLPSRNEFTNFLPQQLPDPVDNQPITYEPLVKGYRVVAAGATELKQNPPGSISARATPVAPIAFQVLR